MPVDPRSYEPLYRQIEAELRDRIRSNEWQPGYKLPPEDRLAHDFGVGKAAVRDALRLLRFQGLIVTRHRDGSYVRERPEPTVVRLSEAALITTRQATPDEVDAYGLEEGDPVLVATYPDGQVEVFVRSAIATEMPPADDG